MTIVAKIKSVRHISVATGWIRPPAEERQTFCIGRRAWCKCLYTHTYTPHGLCTRTDAFTWPIQVSIYDRRI